MARQVPLKPGPTVDQAQKFDLLFPMLASALEEMRALAKKEPNSPLNRLKVKFVNQILSDAKQSLGTDPSAAYLDLLEDDTLPLNSDVVLILGRYQAAMQSFKATYYGWDGKEHRWFTQQ